MNHTSGPWHYTTMRIETRRRDIGAANGANVAEVIEDAGYDETLANARLIAASPDLLAALKNLYALVRGECPSLLENDHHDDMVSAAIAKAEGRREQGFDRKDV